MAKKYLDDTGLSYFWGKIKSALSSKADSSDLNDYLPLTGGTLTGTLNGTDLIASGDLEGENVLLTLNTTATSGTDYEIYTALTSLGWTDVIV